MDSKRKKKAYTSPNLVEWGTIQEVTKGGGSGGQDDGTFGTET